MTDSIVPIYSFDKIAVSDTEHEAVIMYSRFTKSSQKTKNSMAQFAVRFGQHIQSEYELASDLDLYKNALARKFNAFWDVELKWICSDEAGDDRLSDNQIKSLDSARRKVGNTIKYGGDLRELDTSNKCQVFNAKEKEKLESANLAADLRTEAKAVAVDKGLEEGTEEFDKFVAEYIKENTPEDVEGGKEALSSTMVFSQKLGKKLEELEKSGLGDKEFNDFISAIDQMIDKKLKLCIESAAIESELVQQTA